MITFKSCLAADFFILIVATRDGIGGYETSLRAVNRSFCLAVSGPALF